MVVRGQKAARDKASVLRADYVLFWKANIPLQYLNAEGRLITESLRDYLLLQAIASDAPSCTTITVHLV
jgi:hypothetical protein